MWVGGQAPAGAALSRQALCDRAERRVEARRPPTFGRGAASGAGERRKLPRLDPEGRGLRQSVCSPGWRDRGSGRSAAVPDEAIWVQAGPCARGEEDERQCGRLRPAGRRRPSGDNVRPRGPKAVSPPAESRRQRHGRCCSTRADPVQGPNEGRHASGPGESRAMQVKANGESPALLLHALSACSNAEATRGTVSPGNEVGGTSSTWVSPMTGQDRLTTGQERGALCKPVPMETPAEVRAPQPSLQRSSR